MGLRLEAGEPLSLASLYRQYASLVRGVLFRICGPRDLDDLVQETFLRVWKGLGKFEGRSNVKTWIYRIAVNTAIDWKRKRRGLEVELPEEMAGEDPGRGEVCWALLRRGLDRLSVDHRVVLVLESIEGLTLDEIAEVLGVGEGTVKSRLFYARKRLFEFLDENGVNV